MSDNPKDDKMRDYETVHAKQIAINMATEIAVLRNANRDLREKLDRGGGSRRERIATACLAGMLANSSYDGSSGTFNGCAYDAVMFADALIARLDKEVKP
jgi:hypothetical protein